MTISISETTLYWSLVFTLCMMTMFFVIMLEIYVDFNGGKRHRVIRGCFCVAISFAAFSLLNSWHPAELSIYTPFLHFDFRPYEPVDGYMHTASAMVSFLLIGWVNVAAVLALLIAAEEDVKEKERTIEFQSDKIMELLEKKGAGASAS